MQKLIQFSQWGVYEILYQTSFSNTAMKFLNSYLGGCYIKQPYSNLLWDQLSLLGRVDFQ